MTSKCVLCQQLIIHEFRPWEIFIGKQIDQEYLCPRCFQEFQAINQPYCPTCGRLGSFQQCQDCQYWQAQGYRGFYHQALFTYNPAMHDYFKRYKRYGDYRLRLAFQPYLKQKLRKLEPPFIFVPSSQNHWQRRLFDPVMGLFEGIVPLTPALIKVA
ncbi:ComF family protein, partial [Lactobacillus sp. XV13L]|nr:ComF family protein [Lactobacillus sp. XV13L]